MSTPRFSISDGMNIFLIVQCTSLHGQLPDVHQHPGTSMSR